MKVRELIEKLQTVDPELDVETEGCDCHGSPRDVEVITFTGKPFALITRER